EHHTGSSEAPFSAGKSEPPGELMTTAQQILVDTMKVLLLEDAAMARKVVRSVGWFLTCLDALEAAEDMASLRGPFADLAAALQSLGGLTARGSGERLGRVGCLLRECVPALLVAARAHLRSPRDPRLTAFRRQVFSLARKTLGRTPGAPGAPGGRRPAG
ncbi:unnamed protein product, partial [Rangifer tarandus platyrhynchus]